MMPFPKVAVVIIHWNRQALLEKFLPAVLASTWPNLEVVLADNASTDNSVAYVRQHFPGVKIVRNESNYGYAGGYNHALKQVEADYYVLLNNDIEVPAGWIEPIIEAMEADKNLGACQPKILDYKNKTHFEYAGACGGFIDRYAYPFCRGRIFNHLEEDKGQYDTPADIFWATGACMFIRASLFQQAAGFDEYFFAHMEEIDLCWRLQLMGFRLQVIPQSRVYHVGGGTLDKINAHKTYLNFRNSLLMIYKNQASLNLWWIILVRSTLDLIASLQFLARGQWAHSWAIHRAHADFFFKLGRWHKKRREVQHMRHNKQLHGVYAGSIVFAHYALGKKHFSDLTSRLP